MSPTTLRLPPTPVGPDGSPLPATPAWLDEVDPEQARHWYDGLEHTPLTGRVREVDGVEMVEVSFLDGVEMVEVSFLDWVEEDSEVMVHLNGFTDSHRTDVTPALLEPFGTSGLQPSQLSVAQRRLLQLSAGPDADDPSRLRRQPSWLDEDPPGRGARPAQPPHPAPGRLPGIITVVGGPVATIDGMFRRPRTPRPGRSPSCPGIRTGGFPG